MPVHIYEAVIHLPSIIIVIEQDGNLFQVVCLGQLRKEISQFKERETVKQTDPPKNHGHDPMLNPSPLSVYQGKQTKININIVIFQ